ncbi:Hypothetical predicted protein [Mytilus galloprovincialis]|uniref:SGNH hydrolase-type esterase domain-containing protein n=1 Tax=Mytilus galloprovincialis TaxID=29158 RepID=A0A8B6H4A8_MYTGA|nr:Hypothetical predicted protein [Mytilus galloprovincialis]
MAKSSRCQIKRGYIRGKNIENGSRYIQIINCAPTIPNKTTFGRYDVRMFADNGRTECIHCKQRNHPSYACKDKPDHRASNCLRVGKFEDNLINASINGATLEKIDQCLGAAFENHRVKSNGSNVGKVIISLGTNDLSKNKHDSDQVNVYATQAIVKVKQAFPNADIGVCGIIPRKGNSNHIHTVNETATHVNKFLEKLCLKDEVLTYIDVDNIFIKNGNVVKAFYEKNRC